MTDQRRPLTHGSDEPPQPPAPQDTGNGPVPGEPPAGPTWRQRLVQRSFGWKSLLATGLVALALGGAAGAGIHAATDDDHGPRDGWSRRGGPDSWGQDGGDDRQQGPGPGRGPRGGWGGGSGGGPGQDSEDPQGQQGRMPGDQQAPAPEGSGEGNQGGDGAA